MKFWAGSLVAGLDVARFAMNMHPLDLTGF